MKLIFRFDIDTHKCIRDGVPNLLRLSEEEDVNFTFFLNLGKAVSLKESLRDLFGRDTKNGVQLEMMKAKDKFGVFDYLYAALINPPNYTYRKEIIDLCNSSNEVGIHGGRNHALWQKYAKTWCKDQTREEVEWSLGKLKSIVPGFKPLGFASPCWEDNKDLQNVLKGLGFAYSADLRVKNCDSKSLIDENGIIPKIGVNLLGEPGGIAFFENCRVKGWSTQRIVEYVINSVKKHNICVIYDHPYYAGIKEINAIRLIIEMTQIEKIDIVCMKDLL